ncbi:MAG: sigma-70 family RNA polymerase sigma factor [Planctomycetaceae bacterium]|nr:MAG: sigma-70 family RNA polymerase sigma factor [Planctomycetaceae bacterium]
MTDSSVTDGLASDGLSSTDRSLLLRIRGGDEQAAVDLYERYAQRILGLVRNQMASHLRARHEPEDIVQSVFKSIFRGIQSGVYSAPGSGSLWSLISVVAVHKVRKTATRQAASRRDDRRTTSLDGVDDSQLLATHSPEMYELMIREILESLADPERQVVVLRLQGFTVEEVSDRVSLSRRSVERLLCSARKKLADLLLVPAD